MSGRPIDVLQTVTPTALAAFAMAVELARDADPAGLVPGGIPALAAALRRSRARTHVVVAELEAAQLVRRVGYTRAARLFVVELVSSTREKAGPGSGEWRALRARIGGLQRAMGEVQAQRDQAEAELQALRRGRRLEANASLVGMLSDLEHAADCAVPSCRRCLEIGRRVEAGRPEYLAEAELVDQLEEASAVKTAGLELLHALQDRGIGAATRRAMAARAFAQLLAPGG